MNAQKVTLEIVNYVYVQSQISEKRIGTPSKLMNICQKWSKFTQNLSVKYVDNIKKTL